MYKKTKSKAAFKPIYNAVRNRLEFVEAQKHEHLTLDEISTESQDLIEFISTLNHGKYYVQKLKPYLSSPSFCVWFTDTPDYVFRQRRKEQEKELKTQTEDNRDNILRLVLECIGLQPE